MISPIAYGPSIRFGDNSIPSGAPESILTPEQSQTIERYVGTHVNKTADKVGFSITPSRVPILGKFVIALSLPKGGVKLIYLMSYKGNQYKLVPDPPSFYGDYAQMKKAIAIIEQDVIPALK